MLVKKNKNGIVVLSDDFNTCLDAYSRLRARKNHSLNEDHNQMTQSYADAFNESHTRQFGIWVGAAKFMCYHTQLKYTYRVYVG